jgi:hypothetical protein
MNIQFGDNATHIITLSITSLITKMYFQWDFLISPATTVFNAYSK